MCVWYWVQMMATWGSFWKHMNRHAQQTILEVLGTSNSPLSGNSPQSVSGTSAMQSVSKGFESVASILLWFCTSKTCVYLIQTARDSTQQQPLLLSALTVTTTQHVTVTSCCSFHLFFYSLIVSFLSISQLALAFVTIKTCAVHQNRHNV